MEVLTKFIAPSECWAGRDDPECPYTHSPQIVERRISLRPPPSDFFAENANCSPPTAAPKIGEQ